MMLCQFLLPLCGINSCCWWPHSINAIVLWILEVVLMKGFEMVIMRGCGSSMIMANFKVVCFEMLYKVSVGLEIFCNR